MKKFLICFLSIVLLCGCTNTNDINQETSKTPSDVVDGKIIKLDNNKASLDEKQINEYDFVWSISQDTGEDVYTGNKIPENEKIYIAHDIVYYPQLNQEDFTLENYDGETEWAYKYKNENLNNYIFSTLPNLGGEFPNQMMHSSQEAYENPVLHINEAGTYILEGNWHGQILVDLGEDAYDDENKKVNIILNNVNVTCDVGPAIMFKNAYEVDNGWKDKEEHGGSIDLSNAGVIITINDGTENNFTGSNVFRLLKPEYKNERNTVQKKSYKIDGAFYSCVSMLIQGESSGTGILNIESTTYEGLDTELHLTINGGNINIISQDDGINVNEDDVSVFTMNAGRLTIFAGQGAEGDVIDSNGYIVVNGGTILGTTPSSPDEILDSAKGSIVSENARVISSGEARSNLGNPPGGGFNDGGFDFDPNNMPGDFNPGNMPNNFNPGQKPEGMQEPPNKPMN